ncbi:MAG TPA: hypothetical protein VGM89_00115 [Puia sp.]|jgi:hypothetical protein
MRAPLFTFSALLSALLLFACHKSSKDSTADGFIGHWQMTQLTGGPFIDVVRIDREHIFELKLLADSTRQDIYNGNVIANGRWSIQSKDSAGARIDLLVYRDSLGVSNSQLVYQASVSPSQLVLRMYPDVGYKAVYERK